MVLGSHPFSIPLSAVVRAPPDVVWKVLTDIESYPQTFSSTAAAERAGHVKDDAGNGNDDLLGSQWNVTRVSVWERQRFSAKVAVTHVEGAEDGARRSFTLSTDLILGATCSVKRVVEPVAPEDAADRCVAAFKDDESSQGEGDTVGNSHSTRSSQSLSPPSPERCRVTSITTMIPHRWCTRVLGILCCPCLLQSRVRKAMERDLEDLARACEYAWERRRARGEGGGGSVSDLVVRSQHGRQPMDDADVAGGGGEGGIRE